MQVIKVSDSGVCSTTVAHQTKEGIVHNGERLHVHFHSKENSLAVLSPREINDLLHVETKLFSFSLPAPLNSYVYPSPILIARLDANSKLESMLLEEFAAQCEHLGRQSAIVEESATIYDVPAIPIAEHQEEVFEEEEEERDAEEQECSDEEMEEHTDEEWDMEDEEMISVA